MSSDRHNIHGAVIGWAEQNRPLVITLGRVIQPHGHPRRKPVKVNARLLRTSRSALGSLETKHWTSRILSENYNGQASPQGRRIRAPSWIEPCIPALVDKPPTGPNWRHEIKWDGYRIAIVINERAVKVWTRKGLDCKNGCSLDVYKRAAFRNGGAILAHFVLISGSVLAGIAVGAGIIFESNEYSASAHRVEKWLVIGGVAIESICTVCLFVFDEGISRSQQTRIEAQQSKIATLDIKTSEAETEAGKAQDRTSQANERAVKLEKEAADANLNAERLNAENLAFEKLFAPRRVFWSIPREKFSLITALDQFKGTLALLQVVPDFEAKVLASDILIVLQGHGWSARYAESSETNLQRSCRHDSRHRSRSRRPRGAAASMASVATCASTWSVIACCIAQRSPPGPFQCSTCCPCRSAASVTVRPFLKRVRSSGAPASRLKPSTPATKSVTFSSEATLRARRCKRQKRAGLRALSGLH
jgi:hypothetical protein